MTAETHPAPVRTVDGREVPTAGEWTLDPTHTTITFEVRHMMIAKVRGSVGIEEGTIEIGEDPLDSRVEVIVDAASVDTGVEDRDNHLRSADFLDVENFPRLIFRSTGIEVSDGGYRLNGELTVKDVTRPVTLDIEFNGGLIDPYGNPRVAFTATTEVERTEWGLTWNMPLDAGGVLVGDKVKLSIDAEATLAS